MQYASGIHYFDTIDSTNTRARELARQGASHGTVLIADHQTSGRGRRGRSFHSPAGSGIYMSVILRPNCSPQELMHLTCAVAVAACDAVETTAGIRPGIKWINDLILQNRKLGGILTEMSVDAKTGMVEYAVIGIGINCSQTPNDFPADIRHSGQLDTFQILVAVGMHSAHEAAADQTNFNHITELLS